jgi:hypothetical protein
MGNALSRSNSRMNARIKTTFQYNLDYIVKLIVLYWLDLRLVKPIYFLAITASYASTLYS